MNKLFRRLRSLLRRTYVVIYDVGDPEVEVEEFYYGYFSSKAEAREMYAWLRGNLPNYHNAHICRVVEEIKDAPDR